jgi:hypothetical protein
VNILEEYRLRQKEESEARKDNKKIKSFEEGPDHLAVGVPVTISQLVRTEKGSKRKKIEAKVETIKDTLFYADKFRFRKVPIKVLEDGSTHHEAFGFTNEGTYAIIPKGW